MKQKCPSVAKNGGLGTEDFCREDHAAIEDPICTS